MKVEPSGQEMRIVLTAAEVRLLRHALERALFIDTPASEQEAIASFCNRALEQLTVPDSRAVR